jgi:predicted RNase H-like HicB family nuclease
LQFTFCILFGVANARLGRSAPSAGESSCFSRTQPNTVQFTHRPSSGYGISAMIIINRAKAASMANIKIVVEKHSDGYVAYPLGIKGVVVGEGDTYEAALEDVKSAIRFHIETFGSDLLEDEQVLEAYLEEAPVEL